jgi:hypothetical protein
MPPRSRKKKAQEEARSARKAAGLDSRVRIDEWCQGDGAKPFWDIFEKGYLNTDEFKEDKKRYEFEQVYSHVMAGEDGTGRFSRDSLGTTLTNGLDWYAWLLCHLVRFNLEYRIGCLYTTRLHRVEYHRVMWNLIKVELRRKSRERKIAAKSRYSRGSISAKPQRELNTSSNSPSPQEEEEMDSNAGVASVWWYALDDDDLPDKEGQRVVRLRRFCGYTESQFRAILTEEYFFCELNQVVYSFRSTKGLNFREAQQQSFQTGDTYFEIKMQTGHLQP